MRFGLLIYGDLETKTGGYLYDRMLVKWLIERGHEVQIISLTRRSYFENLRDNFNPQLERLLLKLDVDFLLEDELCHPSLCYLNPLIKSRVSYRMVPIVHGLSCSLTRSENGRKTVGGFEKLFLSNVDCFIFNSESSRVETESLIGSSSNGVVAYPGKDHFSPIARSDRDFDDPWLRLIHVANISEYKGLDTLIEGLSGLSDFHLTVIGDVADLSFFERVKQLVEEKNLGDVVDFLGPQDQERLDREMSDSHIFALPSYHEGFGIAYIEALGYGLPVIATNSGGSKEMISDGKEGFLVPPDSPEMIKQHLCQLQEDRTMLRRMSKSAFDKYQSLPTWDQSIERIQEYLSRLED